MSSSHAELAPCSQRAFPRVYSENSFMQQPSEDLDPGTTVAIRACTEMSFQGKTSCIRFLSQHSRHVMGFMPPLTLGNVIFQFLPKISSSCPRHFYWKRVGLGKNSSESKFPNTRKPRSCPSVPVFFVFDFKTNAKRAGSQSCLSVLKPVCFCLFLFSVLLFL